MKCECCGEDVSEIPFDIGYTYPDEIVEVLKRAEAAHDATVMDSELARFEGDDSFMRLDGEKIFMRGLLEVPVAEAARGFRYGVWYEITIESAKKLTAAWDDERAYLALSLSGKLANTLAPSRGDSLGAECMLTPAGPEQRLMATTCSTPWIQALMKTGWTKAEHHAAIKSMLEEDGQ